MMGFLGGGMGATGTPGNNQRQNAQADAAVSAYNLSKEGRELLHRHISKQGYSYDEIMAEAEAISQMGGKYVNPK